MKLILKLALIGVAAAAAALWLTRPKTAPDDVLAGIQGNAARGETVFHSGGCAACHAAPKAEGAARLILSGGRSFASPFGTFFAPNISPDPEQGIGGWSALDLYNALHHGTSPEGRHYYPAFPYTTYVNASAQDIADLFAFLQTLPPDPTPNQDHALPFPFNQRLGLGLWKALYLRPGWVVDGDLPPDAARGRYLVEALGHCAECHTPRGPLGGLERSAWLSGAPNPTGRGTFPNITPAKLNWSLVDLIAYFTNGFTPDYDSAGGEMAEVIENLAQIPESDRAAIAAYLKQVPPVP